jgi:hypothetical protein
MLRFDVIFHLRASILCANLFSLGGQWCWPKPREMRMGEAVVIAGFPVTDSTPLRGRGEHEGVGYEIANHSRSKYDFDAGGVVSGPGTWCYYVIVSEAMLPPELFTEFWLTGTPHEHKSGFPRVSYDYCSARFAQADWHGGVTFYEKSGGHDGAQRYVKIGCDFAHVWDEGKDFDYEQVERECIDTINQLREKYPFRRRCPYYGIYHDASEMVEHKGKLYSVAGIAAMAGAA